MKKYLSPEIEISIFDIEDVITSSPADGGGVHDWEGGREPINASQNNTQTNINIFDN